MPKTNADYQREHRQRVAERLGVLERQNVMLAQRLADAESALGVALEENERLSASQCRHPSAVVDGGRCHACGAEVW